MHPFEQLEQSNTSNPIQFGQMLLAMGTKSRLGPQFDERLTLGTHLLLWVALAGCAVIHRNWLVSIYARRNARRGLEATGRDNEIIRTRIHTHTHTTNHEFANVNAT